MGEQRSGREHLAPTSYDVAGAGRGYDLADRYAELQRTMRDVEFQGHLETATLRNAVVARPSRHRAGKGNTRRHANTLRAAPAES